MEALRKAVPGLTDGHISLMQRCPMRSWDPELIKEPHIYRLYEVSHRTGAPAACGFWLITYRREKVAVESAAEPSGLQAVMHYGEAIKAIMNEEAGDGIESAIDCFLDVKVIEGKAGEKRLCVVINGKVRHCFCHHLMRGIFAQSWKSQYFSCINTSAPLQHLGLRAHAKATQLIANFLAVPPTHRAAG